MKYFSYFFLRFPNSLFPRTASFYFCHVFVPCALTFFVSPDFRCHFCLESSQHFWLGFIRKFWSTRKTVSSKLLVKSSLWWSFSRAASLSFIMSFLTFLTLCTYILFYTFPELFQNQCRFTSQNLLLIRAQFTRILCLHSVFMNFLD